MYRFGQGFIKVVPNFRKSKDRRIIQVSIFDKRDVLVVVVAKRSTSIFLIPVSLFANGDPHI
jgi:hypothetical protein